MVEERRQSQLFDQKEVRAGPAKRLIHLSTGSYSAIFTSLGLKLGGSFHKAIGKPPTPENFPSESI